MRVEEIKRVLVSQREEMEEFVRRERIVSREPENDVVSLISSGGILAILGVRRSGKSVLSWRASGEKKLYVNFFDERLSNFKASDFERLLNAARQLWGEPEFIVLDEVQEITGWERFVSRLGLNYKVIVTGSSSRLLSGELGTYLTGRHIDLTLFPFSFREFLLFRGFNLDLGWTYSDRMVSRVISLLEEYLEAGGFPESVRFGKVYLSLIYRDIVERDIMLRHSVRHRSALRELARYLMSNYSNEFTYSRLGSLVGIRDVHTVRDYVSYLEEAYLLFQVRRFSFKPKAQLNSPRKVYPVDVGLARTLSMKAHPERGRIIELAVYLELMRRMSYSFTSGEIFYWRDERGEVDFILKRNGELLPIQVTYQLDGNTDREVGNIIRVAKSLGMRRGLVVTWEDEEEITREGVKIDVVPLWKFLTVFNPF
ncbi:ATP-binding protein [Thermococcus indicus]|uniref:ATP-binding protein n=1 Tax=Thermococcus indicus TaxID=2586643 RepID=A0A4Y5SLA9_9EURY|nr:ATP-binding protein [Thermococcus indicus]QDA31668.1 ATP-binding protein [Thermococcus indicus]